MKISIILKILKVKITLVKFFRNWYKKCEDFAPLMNISQNKHLLMIVKDGLILFQNEFNLYV